MVSAVHTMNPDIVFFSKNIYLSHMKSSLSFFLIFLMVLLRSYAQNANGHTDEDILGYISNVMNFHSVNPQEKVYLHFDNTGYFKGERIWYKAYVVRNNVERKSLSDYVPTDKSSILYVELLNSYGETVVRQKLKIENGMAYGDISLDSILSSGFYEVRAYTRYMMNFGADAAFSRIFPVFKKPEKNGDYSHPELNQLSWRKRLPNRNGEPDEPDRAHVRFFPEGGSRIRGLPCRMAYIISDGEGEIKRDVVGTGGGPDEAPFVFLDRKGRERTASYPEALEEGCAMRVDAMEGDLLTMQLQFSGGMSGSTVAWMLSHEGTILTCDTLSAEGTFTKSFERGSLPAGVSQITVINDKGHIIAERLFFIPPMDDGSDSLRITSEKHEISPCGKVRLHMRGLPQASYSFSAMHANTLVNGDHGSMAAYLLLGSDVRGYIANPDYYLEADDQEHRRAADLLMLTQGWRRYDIEFMDGAFAREKLEPVEDKNNLYGRVTDKSRERKPMEGMEVKAFLYNRSGQSLSGSATTDRLGNYIFSLPDLSGDWSLQLNATLKGRLKPCNITIDRRFAPSARTLTQEETRLIPIPKANLTFRVNREDTTILRANGTYLLPQVKIKGKSYLTDDTNFRWYNEATAAHYSTIYYDCDAVSDELYDKGEDIPEFYEWLSKRNSFFKNDQPQLSWFMNYLGSLFDKYEAGKADANNNLDINKNVSLNDEGIYEYDFLTTNTSRSINVYTDGYTYKNHPVIWIQNNRYAGATGVGSLFLDKNSMSRIPDTERGIPRLKTYLLDAGYKEIEFDNLIIHHSTNESLPTMLSDVKSVYIGENPKASENIVSCNELVYKNAVNIFLFTHPSFSTERNKGIRRTHYQGYNIPTKFEMEDYSVVPPVNDDFRRTLYWNPDVRTDKNGNATIEFWNNSTCRDMYISIEGMTEDGKFIGN